MGWFSDPEMPNSYKATEPGPRFPKTASLSYDELQEKVLDLEDEIRHLREDADSARTDLFARRLELIRTGKPLPDPEPLYLLPNWSVHQVREQVAKSNREIDEDNERHGGPKAPA
jgi:hypothetical protein